MSNALNKVIKKYDRTAAHIENELSGMPTGELKKLIKKYWASTGQTGNKVNSDSVKMLSKQEIMSYITSTGLAPELVKLVTPEKA